MAANQEFAGLVWDYYEREGRTFPWRENTDPYYVFVSEVMLQQTGTARVASKFSEFVRQFPDFGTLAGAGLSELLAAWQGLGYNRRAKYLKEAASVIAERYESKLPGDEAQLRELPGIGKNTAASILAFAYNLPTVFVETNIRTVFIHHFFPGEESVSDARIIELVRDYCDLKRPREWYWALMDYGVWLKKNVGNLSRQSRTYRAQSPFKGSRRQMRGIILRLLSVEPDTVLSLEKKAVARFDEANPSRGPDPTTRDIYLGAVSELMKEGLVAESGGRYLID